MSPEKTITAYFSLGRLIILISFVSCSPKLFKEKWTEEEAPAYFKARFETTQGNFDIEAKRAWSPEGVDRLYQLIKNEFYSDIAIFRVVPGFVAQFGIHNDSLINASWRSFKIEDEEVVESNDFMTISFARVGVKTRTTQLQTKYHEESWQPFNDSTRRIVFNDCCAAISSCVGLRIAQGCFENQHQPVYGTATTSRARGWRNRKCNHGNISCHINCSIICNPNWSWRRNLSSGIF